MDRTPKNANFQNRESNYFWKLGIFSLSRNYFWKPTIQKKSPPKINAPYKQREAHFQKKSAKNRCS